MPRPDPSPPHHDPSSPDDLDPGLANERTALAWNRTALSLAAIGGLGVKIGVEGRVPYLSLPLGAFVLLAAAWAFLYGLGSYRARRGAAATQQVLPEVVLLRVFAYGTTTVAVVAFALALVA